MCDPLATVSWREYKPRMISLLLLAIIVSGVPVVRYEYSLRFWVQKSRIVSLFFFFGGGVNIIENGVLATPLYIYSHDVTRYEYSLLLWLQNTRV